MAKSFARRSNRTDEDMFVPRLTADVRRSIKRGKLKAALRAEIAASLIDA